MKPEGFDKYYNQTRDAKLARALAFAHENTDEEYYNHILETGTQKQVNVLQMKILLSLQEQISSLNNGSNRRKNTYNNSMKSKKKSPKNHAKKVSSSIVTGKKEENEEITATTKKKSVSDLTIEFEKNAPKPKKIESESEDEVIDDIFLSRS